MKNSNESTCEMRTVLQRTMKNAKLKEICKCEKNEWVLAHDVIPVATQHPSISNDWWCEFADADTKETRIAIKQNELQKTEFGCQHVSFAFSQTFIHHFKTKIWFFIAHSAFSMTMPKKSNSSEGKTDKSIVKIEKMHLLLNSS